MLFFLGAIAFVAISTYWNNPMRRYGFSLFSKKDLASIYNNSIVNKAFKYTLLEVMMHTLMAFVGIGGFALIWLFGIDAVSEFTGGSFWGFPILIFLHFLALFPLIFFASLSGLVDKKFAEHKKCYEQLKGSSK